MKPTKVDLLDPDQEPSDEQLTVLMQGFGEAVRVKKAIGNERLPRQLEQALTNDGSAPPLCSITESASSQ